MNQNEEVTVYDLGLSLFRDEVVHHSLVKEHLKTTLLAMVAQERRGEIVDRFVCVCWGRGHEIGCVRGWRSVFNGHVQCTAYIYKHTHKHR